MLVIAAACVADNIVVVVVRSGIEGVSLGFKARELVVFLLRSFGLLLVLVVCVAIVLGLARLVLVKSTAQLPFCCVPRLQIARCARCSMLDRCFTDDDPEKYI